MDTFPTKYIFVTGGVTSSLGKGIISASLGKLLQARGYSVTIQKFDPYINIDPGTLNPYEHGECFVTDDGAETDLDLGHYERFLNTPTSQANNVTTGRVYQSVIEKERKGDYLGKTVQVVPHITDEIKNRFRTLAKSGNYQFVITEIGGTVGDIESLPYIEAVRQMKWEYGKDCIDIHLTLLPYLNTTGELKTKPTQHSVKSLLEYGVQPDILVCRTICHIDEDIRQKLARFCNVATEAVIEAMDAKTIYEVPLLMEKEKLDVVVLKKLGLPAESTPDLSSWTGFLEHLRNPKHRIRIALVGKYVELRDSYKSIAESFVHAGAANETQVDIEWIHSEDVNPETAGKLFQGIRGIVVAPGFGKRGIEGKITAIKHARENNIPFLGICLGMQCAVIEFARNVLGFTDAHSTEVNPATTHPVIDLQEAQKRITRMGGTMRLGAYPCVLKEGTRIHSIYKKTEVSERHRHRYEFNNEYLSVFEKAGMKATGLHPEAGLVEIVELKDHPWFIGVQFHPEYKSTVANPHPLFLDFVKAALEYKLGSEAAKKSISKN
ncbi:MAG: CTP synthase [Bacteroidia bacterium]|nr:CTP synthase [Bacteroidia bacterium]